MSRRATPRAARRPLPPEVSDDPRLMAAVDLIGRSGASDFQIRYCDEVDPLIWIAAARWQRDQIVVIRADGQDEPASDHVWEVAAAINPLRAIFRLCDQVIDGGQCRHCSRPTGFSSDIDPMPLDSMVCWYQWDPELSTFRRGCSGGGW